MRNMMMILNVLMMVKKMMMIMINIYLLLFTVMTVKIVKLSTIRGQIIITRFYLIYG